VINIIISDITTSSPLPFISQIVSNQIEISPISDADVGTYKLLVTLKDSQGLSSSYHLTLNVIQ